MGLLSSRFEVRGSRFEVRGSRFEVRIVEASVGLDEWLKIRMRCRGGDNDADGPGPGLTRGTEFVRSAPAEELATSLARVKDE
jgi:hypothetical protein